MSESKRDRFAGLSVESTARVDDGVPFLDFQEDEPPQRRTLVDAKAYLVAAGAATLVTMTQLLVTGLVVGVGLTLWNSSLPGPYSRELVDGIRLGWGSAFFAWSVWTLAGYLLDRTSDFLEERVKRFFFARWYALRASCGECPIGRDEVE